MPIYEYRCENGHLFEVIQSMSADPVVACEQCGAPVERVFHPVAVHFKGSGFYNTDYKGKGPGAGATGEDGGGKQAGEGGGEQGGEGAKGGEPSSGDGASGSNSDSRSGSGSGSGGPTADSGKADSGKAGAKAGESD